MKFSASAVIFNLLFKINIVYTKYDFIQTNDVEENFSMSCDSSLHCEKMGFSGFKCIDNLCICKDMCMTPHTEVSVTKIGKSCKRSFQCNILHSYCNEKGKCDCIIDTIASEDQRRCLNVSYSFGSECQESKQCLPINGICRDGKCCCPNGMHIDKGICFNSVGLGRQCTRDEECSSVPFSICKSNKCVCSPQHVESKSGMGCLLKAELYLSFCSEDLQCSSNLGSGSVCADGVCVCTELHQYKLSIKKCVLDARLGEVCGTHTDCHQPGHEESRLECILGVCKCKPDYFEDEGYCISNSSENKISFTLRAVLPYVITYLFFYIIA